MTEAVELLAFKLAGLTFIQGAQEVIAKEFGELFIETEPSGADIYINGIKKGVSPNLFSKVPIGVVIVECRKDNLYGRTEVKVSPAVNKVKVELSVVYGNLFIKSSEKAVKVYLAELEQDFL